MKKPNVDKYFNSVVEAVDLLFQKKLIGQALTIIYSSIDAFGLLNAPENQETATGQTFKAWVNKYMLVYDSLEYSADDLWGARCAILHTHTSESYLSKASKVREIQYISGPSEHPVVKRAISISKDLANGNYILINVDLLVINFLNAIGKFSKEFAEHAKQSEVCRKRASKILSHFTM